MSQISPDMVHPDIPFETWCGYLAKDPLLAIQNPSYPLWCLWDPGQVRAAMMKEIPRYLYNFTHDNIEVRVAYDFQLRCAILAVQRAIESDVVIQVPLLGELRTALTYNGLGLPYMLRFDWQLIESFGENTPLRVFAGTIDIEPSRCYASHFSNMARIVPEEKQVPLLLDFVRLFDEHFKRFL
jgi:hypothetical protein